MIERTLTHTTKSEDEGPLAKVGRKRNVGVCQVGIELPPLNAALVEVHRELAKVSIGAKDMANKNKDVSKAVKQTQVQLQKANERIAELEHGVTTTLRISGSMDSNDALHALREELEAQIAIATKAKRATQLAKSEIDRLRAGLRQSSNRETDI